MQTILKNKIERVPLLSLYNVISSKFLNLTFIEPLHWQHCTYSTGLSNKVIIKILFGFNSC